MPTGNPVEPGEIHRHISIGDTRLFVRELGQGAPILILHGGPGLDHHMFGDYLDPLSDRYRLIFVDQRSQGHSDRAPVETWSLEKMAEDILQLAEAMELERYAVLGHSFGAMVALQSAVGHPGRADRTVVSSGIPSSRYLEAVWQNLEKFEPEELREQVADSWERETSVETPEDVANLLRDQLPFQFADAFDPRMADYEMRTAGARYSPEVLLHFALQDYGGIEVEDRLGEVTGPMLVLAGKHDRTCTLAAARAIAQGVPGAELVVFEKSAHMTFVEENEKYLEVVRRFLD